MDFRRGGTGAGGSSGQIVLPGLLLLWDAAAGSRRSVVSPL